jgi:hypothetical protein
MYKIGNPFFSRSLHKRRANGHNSSAGKPDKINGGKHMTFQKDVKRETSDRNRRSNPNERKRADSNRDGDSQRNRSDDDLFGADDEY